MEIIKYTEEWRDKWDEFVLHSNNGTIFQMQRFFDYHLPGKFNFNHLVFLKNGNIAGVLPGAIYGRMFESPVGASYGSIVTGDLKYADAEEFVESLKEYALNNNIDELLLTPAPLIYEECPNQDLEFALLWGKFSYRVHYISSAIKLDPERDLISRFSPTIRRNIRMSLKNKDIRVELNERYDEFYPILIENKAKHNVKPTHSYDDLLRLKDLFPDEIKLFMVYYQDKPIAGSLMFYANKKVGICFYNMLRYEYAHLKPIQRVMYDVTNYSTGQGYSYVDIGVSQDTSAIDPMTPSKSLIEFKEKFDAKTILRNTFYSKLR